MTSRESMESLLSLLPSGATSEILPGFTTVAPASSNELCWKTSAGPTEQSHYITDTLVGGGMPALSDVQNLENFIDIFVCLRGEYTSSNFLTNPEFYPHAIKKGGRRNDVVFVHFPAEDFEAFTSDNDLVKVINFVGVASWQHKKRVMVHCRGGHGRTIVVVGLVMIWLLSASKSVLTRKQNGGKEEESLHEGSLLSKVIDKLYELHRSRVFCRYRCDLPETEEQWNQMKRVEKRVREYAEEHNNK